MHCVVTVVDGNSIATSAIPKEITSLLRSLETFLHDKNVPNVIVVTKIDKCDANVEANIINVYNSSAISDIVKKAAEEFGVQEMDVFPVQNYTNEIDLDDNKNILLLLALRRILYQADDFIKDEFNRQNSSVKNLPIRNQKR